MTPRSIPRVVLRCCVAGFVLGCEHPTAPPPVERVVLQLCADELPVWVAFQNEGSNWTRATISPGATLPLDVTGHVAIATVYSSENGLVGTNVLYTSAAALKSDPFALCPSTIASGTKTVSGSVTGLGAGQNAQVTMGQRLASSTGGFTLSTLPDGALDLVAGRLLYQSPNVSADRIVVRRALDVPSGSMLPVIDFASTEAVSPAINTITLNGFTTGELGPVSHAVITANGTNASFFSNNAPAQTLTAYSLPAALLVNGDLQLLRIERYTFDPFVGRTTIAYYTVPSDMTIELGGPLATPDITTLSSSPTLRFRARMERQADYSNSMYVSFMQSGRLFSITVKEDYYTTPPAVWEAAMVDFRGVDGWQDTWTFVSGTSVNWFALGSGPVQMNNGVPISGSTYRSAYRSGSM